MTAVKLKDIKGVMLNNEACIQKYNHNTTNKVIDPTGWRVNEILKSTLSEQGEVEIGLCREKLAHHIYCIRIGVNVNPKRWDEIGGDYKKQYYDIADAIIANQKDLFERVK